MKSKTAAPLLIGAVALLLAAGGLDAQQRGAGLGLVELLSVDSLSCEFGLPSEDEATSPPGHSITFTAISVAAGTASGGDPSIGGDVRIMPTNLGLHFYQFDDNGALSLVTVTASRDEAGRYAAVLSRHHTDGEALEPSQREGSCSAPANGD